jgi:hypothetical protein
MRISLSVWYRPAEGWNLLESCCCAIFWPRNSQAQNGEHTRHVEWEVSSQESRTFAGEIHSSLSPRLIRLSAIRDPLDLIGLGGAAALGVFVDLFRHAIITWIGTGTAQPKSVLAAATRAM